MTRTIPPMTRLLAYSYDHLSCIAAYGSPEPHSHLALHFIFSVGGAFPGTAGGKTFEGRAVFIGSDVPHTLNLERRDAIVFLFEPVSALGRFVKEAFLRDKEFFLPGEGLLCRIAELVSRCSAFCPANGLCGMSPEEAGAFDRELLGLLGWNGTGCADTSLDVTIQNLKHTWGVPKKANFIAS